jgi:hypothetical protein
MTVQTAGRGGFWNRARRIFKHQGAYQRLENPVMVPLYKSSPDVKTHPGQGNPPQLSVKINCVPRDEAALRRFKPEEQIAR